LEGKLFFDYNGSGLQEEGEPTISGFGVCANDLFSDEDVCVISDKDGFFSLSEIAPEGMKVDLRFVDPNADDPALAFRYINLWKGPVVIPAYEMNRVQVPEQHLNNTEAIPIHETAEFEAGMGIELGLMQGFFTLPYLYSDKDNYWIINYVDLDINFGTVRNYFGNKNKFGDPIGNPVVIRTTDQHYGIDFDGPEGAWVLSPAFGIAYYIGEEHNQIQIMHVKNLSTGLGHFNNLVVSKNQQLFRGQIVAINGTYNTHHPHIHFGLYLEKGDIPAIDPFRDLINDEFIFMEYLKMEDAGYRQGQKISIGSPGFWTKDNDPQFPLVEIKEE